MFRSRKAASIFAGVATDATEAVAVADRLKSVRSLLFIPGNSQKMLAKSLTLVDDHQPDVIVFDLEDSVPLAVAEKLQARKMVSDFIAGPWREEFEKRKNEGRSMPLLVPRVNATEDLLEGDISAICTNDLVHGITVGKTSIEQDVYTASDLISCSESKHGLNKNSIKLIPTIETALGLINAFKICSVSERIVAVAFGADDYATDLGFTRNTKNAVEPELFYVRSQLAVAARAAGVPSWDTPNVNFKDEQGLISECEAVKQMGFKGKFAIHPNQVAQINRIFGISQQEYELAKRIVEQWDKSADEHGRGSINVDGRMVDVPVYKRYRNVVHMYELQHGIAKQE